MKKTLICFALLSLFLSVQQVLAQCLDNSYQFLDVNQVSARFNNGGNFFWDMVSTPDYQTPKGSGLTPVFGGGLWVGGLDPQNQLHIAAASYRQGGWEWYAGPTRTPGQYVCPNAVATTTPIFFNGIKRLRNGKCILLTSTEVLVYDPQTQAMFTRALPATRTWMDAIELPDGRVMLVGDDTYPVKNPVLFMDTVSYTIAGGPTLIWFHKESSLTLLQSGKVLLAGADGCEVFDPLTNISTAVGALQTPRIKHAAVALSNGEVLVLGGGAGLNGTGTLQNTEIFDDSLGNWFAGPDLLVARQRARATQMPSGKIFVSGGTTGSTVTEWYDAGTNAITAAATLPGYVDAHSVAVMDSDEVVIAKIYYANSRRYLYRFNVLTGQYAEIHVQRTGSRMIGLDSTKILVQVEDSKHLQVVDTRTDVQEDDRWQYVWKIGRLQIDQFRADFAAQTVDFSRYPQIESWPAHGDVGVGEDRNLAPFVDMNFDGLYRPAVDGDYPCIVGDQALWWVINDDGPHDESLGLPLGVQVEAMAYAVDCQQSACPDSSVDYSIFLHLELTNHSTTAYHDMYFGDHIDYDLGDLSDDYFASDSSRHLCIGYNATDVDGRYGLHPPAWGSAVLPNGQLGTMASAMTYEVSSGVPYGYAQSPTDYYNYLTSRFHDSLHVVNNGLNGYPGTASGPTSNYMYSTQGFCGGQLSGWSEPGAGNAPSERRFIQSSGPFALQPGEKIQWDLAFIYARDSSNLESVCKLQSSTTLIQNWWQNQLDRSCFNIVVDRTEAVPKQGFKVYPNPSTNGLLHLDFGTALTAPGDVQILDLQGRVLDVLPAEQGSENLEFHLRNLPAGMYLLRLHSGDRLETQRLILE